MVVNSTTFHETPATSLQLNLAGTFTLEPLEPVLKFWSEELSLPVNVTFAPYGQLFQA